MVAANDGLDLRFNVKPRCLTRFQRFQHYFLSPRFVRIRRPGKVSHVYCTALKDAACARWNGGREWMAGSTERSFVDIIGMIDGIASRLAYAFVAPEED